MYSTEAEARAAVESRARALLSAAESAPLPSVEDARASPVEGAPVECCDFKQRTEMCAECGLPHDDHSRNHPHRSLRTTPHPTKDFCDGYRAAAQPTGEEVRRDEPEWVRGMSRPELITLVDDAWTALHNAYSIVDVCEYPITGGQIVSWLRKVHPKSAPQPVTPPTHPASPDVPKVRDNWVDYVKVPHPHDGAFNSSCRQCVYPDAPPAPVPPAPYCPGRMPGETDAELAADHARNPACRKDRGGCGQSAPAEPVAPLADSAPVFSLADITAGISRAGMDTKPSPVASAEPVTLEEYPSGRCVNCGAGLARMRSGEVGCFVSDCSLQEDEFRVTSPPSAEAEPFVETLKEAIRHNEATNGRATATIPSAEAKPDGGEAVPDVPWVACGCGELKCEGVHDNERHQCGGPKEACTVPGCPECGAAPVDAAYRARREETLLLMEQCPACGGCGEISNGDSCTPCNGSGRTNCRLSPPVPTEDARTMVLDVMRAVFEKVMTTGRAWTPEEVLALNATIPHLLRAIDAVRGEVMGDELMNAAKALVEAAKRPEYRTGGHLIGERQKFRDLLATRVMVPAEVIVARLIVSGHEQQVRDAAGGGK